MDSRTNDTSTAAAFGLAICLVLPAVGCGVREIPPLRSPYPTARSIVVAPLLNQSPSSDFDSIVATDTLVSELSQVDGLVVLPTNRALKVLIGRGRTHATSVAEGVDLAHELGADGVIIGAITEYDPYTPQKVGMTLQLIWVRADMTSGGLDPVRLARRASSDERFSVPGGGHGSQVQAVLDAGSNEVTRRVQAYASSHQGQDSPYGWRRFLVDSDAYMQFVCHEMIVRLMNSELRRITMPVRTY